MQAAFRAQNPHLFNVNGEYKRKENAYLFDFDPARTLDIFEQFANDLSSKTAQGKGTKKEHETKVTELMNFFPVYGEDEEGKMIALGATQVLRIPRKIRSTEVIQHGFISNFLFQNISTVFKATKSLTDILSHLTPAHEEEEKIQQELQNLNNKNISYDSLSNKEKYEIVHSVIKKIIVNMKAKEIIDIIWR